MREELKEAAARIKRARASLDQGAEYLGDALEEIDRCCVIPKPQHGRVVLQYVQDPRLTGDQQPDNAASIREALAIADDSRLLVHAQFVSGVELIVRPRTGLDDVIAEYERKLNALEAAAEARRKFEIPPGYEA